MYSHACTCDDKECRNIVLNTVSFRQIRVLSRALQGNSLQVAGATFCRFLFPIIAPSQIYSETHLGILLPVWLKYISSFNTHTFEDGCLLRQMAAFLTYLFRGMPAPIVHDKKSLLNSSHTCSTQRCRASTLVLLILKIHLTSARSWRRF